jgi:putative ATPase
MTLFAKTLNQPLAEILRPQHLDEVVGQSHLLGEGKPLRLAFVSGQLHSMILWGPPGVGKTTLARLMAKAFNSECIALSAVFSGVKDIRLAVEQAQNNALIGKRTILFIDEIHRFNKAQQDALLPYTESGLVTFIGATTENPSFEVNSALLSRTQVYILQALQDKDLLLLFQRAQTKLFPELVFDDDARDAIISAADGDARRFLNLLEQTRIAVDCLKKSHVDKPLILTVLTDTLKRFDKNGEVFYDQISALHKSVRGSNPDAALYWFCRMIDGGVDPQYLSRRIVRMAWEDIGLADPRAFQVVNDAAATYDRLGSPEGVLALAQAILYLAVAAKSNAGYKAFNEAMAFVKKDKSREVPLHLRNAPTKLMKDAGYGKTYRYAHDEPYAYAAGEVYLPEGMENINWYRPTSQGLEIKIKDKLVFLQKLDEEFK